MWPEPAQHSVNYRVAFFEPRASPIACAHSNDNGAASHAHMIARPVAQARPFGKEHEPGRTAARAVSGTRLQAAGIRSHSMRVARRVFFLRPNQLDTKVCEPAANRLEAAVHALAEMATPAIGTETAEPTIAQDAPPYPAAVGVRSR